MTKNITLKQRFLICLCVFVLCGVFSLYFVVYAQGDSGAIRGRYVGKSGYSVVHPHPEITTIKKEISGRLTRFFSDKYWFSVYEWANPKEKSPDEWAQDKYYYDTVMHKVGGVKIAGLEGVQYEGSHFGDEVMVFLEDGDTMFEIHYLVALGERDLYIGEFNKFINSFDFSSHASLNSFDFSYERD